jgi:hypothetical protein
VQNVRSYAWQAAQGAAMISNPLRLGCTLLALAWPLAATAQDRGRTDGPEGSEYGKGGYKTLGTGRFSLQVSGGAAFPDNNQAPFFVGGGFSYWATDSLVWDFEGAYLANNKIAEGLTGPRFRTETLPVGLCLPSLLVD